MSIPNYFELGLTLLSVGAVIGLWIYSARNTEPRDVMLLLGSTLASSRRNRER